MQDNFKQVFALYSLEIIFSFLIKMSTQKAMEQKLHLFIPLGIQRVARLIISFVLEMSVITSLQTDTDTD